MDALAEPFFLNVERSALGQAWRARCDATAEREALTIAQHHGMSEVLAQIMAGRGISAQQAEAFLKPRLRDVLPDPHSLQDMEKASQMISAAMIAQKKIVIFGDYDVDGACSAAILTEYIQHFSKDVRFYIPDRITEGYGPNLKAIEGFAAEGAALLICVDCGSLSFEPLERAKALGMQVIVLDHHQCDINLPNIDAVVNPNRQDDISGLGYICAAGVVFMTIVAMNRHLRQTGYFSADKNSNASPAQKEPDLMASLDLVALATVADVMPLRDLNRSFVAQGLKLIQARHRLGLNALLDVARLKGKAEAWHMGFLVGPRINAGGRIGDASLGAKLLLCTDEAECIEIAQQLDVLNHERRAIEQQMVAEAEVLAADIMARDAPSVLFVHQKGWHQGIVGLVASRVKERHYMPVFALAMGENGLLTGSGRSITGVDLGQAIRKALEAGLLKKGGGHAMAAGITIEEEMRAPLQSFMNDFLREDVIKAKAQKGLRIDALITPMGANPALIQECEQAGPFGQGNPEPVFAFANLYLKDVIAIGEGGHLRLRLQSPRGDTLGAIAFRARDSKLGDAIFAAKGKNVHVAGTLSIDRWGGQEKVDLKLLDLAEAK